MKKKVFSLMMTLLLAFMGVAKADVVTIGEGTATNTYLPSYSYYKYALSQQLYTPAEITTGGTISSIAFYNGGAEKTRTYDLYMVNTVKTSFASSTDWITVTAADKVFSGDVTMVADAWTTITLDTPFEYDGTSNLAIIMDDNSGAYTPSPHMACRVFDATNMAIRVYSDGTDYSPMAPTSYTGSVQTVKNQIQLTITPGGGGGGVVVDKLHVKYMDGNVEIIDSLNLGVRPLNAWMEPFEFTMYSEGPTYTVNVLDFTPSDGLFSVAGEELPFQVTSTADVELNMTTNAAEAGVIERQFVAITAGNRAAHIWPVVVEVYDPAIPDVVEKAYNLGTVANGFSYQGIPSQITPTVLHNDYTLPFPQIPEGVDAVYKFTVASDMIINAHVDETAANGKVALYMQQGDELPHPMADNNYQGLLAGGGGAAGAPFEAMIGDETNTTYTAYMPFYTLYNYSISEALFTAAELEEAGVTTAPMGSLSWEAIDVTTTQAQNNISIWMANVDDTELTTTSHIASGMTLVYTGNIPTVPPMGWNEFVFNEGNFAWDGVSNVLILVQRNNGQWSGHVNWRSHNPGFYGMTYKYQDSTPYDVTTQTYAVTRSNTSRPNTMFKSTGRGEVVRTPLEVSAGPVIVNLPVKAGTYYLVASATQPDYTVYINADDMPCPAIDADGFAFNPQPADNEDNLEPAAVTLRWQIPEYATGWRLVFGSTYHPEAGHPQTVIYPEDGSFSPNMVNSYTVRNLWNNTNYFWRVEFNNSACPAGVSSPVWGFTTHLNIPQNLTASDETIFDDETVTLTWNAVVDRTYRMYRVYRDGELIGSTQVNNIGATTFTDGPLAYNMGGYTYYVTAVYDEGESAPSNEVIVKVSGYGNVDGHVYEQDGVTGIANATVTMVGQDEFGANHTYTFTTNGQGYYTGHIYAGTYNGSAACNGYQGASAPIQGNPVILTYNNTTSPIDYIMDENFDAVCTVIAEYYPDSLDPESPYVKVYWGCGLPGEEIVEPFETGDFSLFDWQLDPIYPWTITTNNPYEGTYCMKSGGAGVANVVSNMTVTVNIPVDGIMSYYGKISCENNWDYGYFFIDGVQMAQYTGTSNWAEKSFDITAGDHTFQWRYTKDGSVNSNDDCFYVDYISFYRRPEPPQPAQPGWHTYAEADFSNAVGSNVGTSRWAYEYPVSLLGSYAGFQLTKVSLFSDNMYSAVGGNYTCTIYQGGNEPMAGTAVSTITVDVPQNQNAWVDFDLTTPVSVSGTEKLWVVWTANTHLSNWPAGCCDGLVEEGTWWNPGVEAGYDWDHQTYGTWTMRQYFTNREGRGFYSYASDNAPVKVDAPVVMKGAPVIPVKGQETVTTVCANPNANPSVRVENNSRSLDHYRVYRTNCYNDGPYEEPTTVLLATVWVPDTVYIDVEWADLPAGVYKWGIGAVYSGNRGEEIESPIVWSEPVNVNPDMANRDVTYDFEDGQIPSGWTNDGTYPWTVVNNAYAGYNGTYCIKSGNSGVANSTSSISATVNYPEAGTVSFLGGFWGEGSNDSYDWDKCRFYIDGAIMIDYGAHQMWENVSFNVSAGDHTFTWTYKKDGSVNPTGDAFFVDDVTFAGSNGGGGGGQGGDIAGAGGEPIQLERESVITWSNCLDKDMYLRNNDVTVNVLLNSADSPEGVMVSFTNLNEVEQELYPIDPIILDETGYYAFESFRKGNYTITVELDGYETIVDENVSIWEPTDLRYVMIEIIYSINNLYVSSTGWAMWDAEGLAPTPGPGPGPGGNGDTFSVNFDNGMPAGWTTIDANNDGYNWVLGSQIGGIYLVSGASLSGSGHNSSADLICSGSYSNATGQAITPDNYLVSPQVTLAAGSTFSFWACAQDSGYPAEHFGVFISDNGTSNWTMVNEWTMTAKGGGVMSIGRDGNHRAQGNWYNYSVDLSAFAGQKYIAIRHFSCNDQFILDVDDIELTAGAKSNRTEWTFANGFVTDPGAMANGADASWTKGGQGTWGPGCQMANGNRIGDSFTLTAATTIDEITVYGYQTGSSTTSTFNGLYAQIYNGNPMSGGTVVWGDANANIMTATAFTNCYRGSDGEATATTRPIMSITASGLNIELEAGTYYLVWQLNGTGSSGPWGAPHAEPNIGNTGNGVQYVSTGWQNLLDGGTNAPYGCAMSLHGNQGGGQGPINPDAGNVLGAMIFVDGEWEAFVEYPTNTYTYEGEGNVACVRMVYNGTNNLPEGNIYYSMSCPECEDLIPGFQPCEPGAPIHADVDNTYDRVRVWWGNEPQPPMEEWLYYDNGNYDGSMGAGGAIYWGVMFPSNDLAAYDGTSLTKVAIYENSYNTGAITLNIYAGGTTAPAALVHTQNVTPVGGDDFHEVVLSTPVLLDVTQNLWITCYQAGDNYPAHGSADLNNPNGRWVSVDGASWMDLNSAGYNYTWLLRGFVTNQAKGGEMVILPDFKGNVGGELSHIEVESTPVDLSFMTRNRATLIKYNVYRSSDNVTYDMVGSVDEDNSGYYEFFDEPGAGNYYYQVRALYDDDCESEPAPAFDNPTQNYVEVEVTGVGENVNEVALYPNPTKGNVTIAAKGMNHITVVSVLGQVVYDADVNADEMTLNMSQFNAGMYTVRVSTAEGVAVRRVTVVR